jgi:hypothetical protein
MERFMQCLACTDCSYAVPNKPPFHQNPSPPYRGVQRVPPPGVGLPPAANERIARSAEGPSVRVTGEHSPGLRAHVAPATVPVAGQDGACTSHAESARLQEAGAGGHWADLLEMVIINEKPLQPAPPSPRTVHHHRVDLLEMVKSNEKPLHPAPLSPRTVDHLHAATACTKEERELWAKRVEQRLAAQQHQHDHTVRAYNQLSEEIGVPSPHHAHMHPCAGVCMRPSGRENDSGCPNRQRSEHKVAEQLRIRDKLFQKHLPEMIRLNTNELVYLSQPLAELRERTRLCTGFITAVVCVYER